MMTCIISLICPICVPWLAPTGLAPTRDSNLSLDWIPEQSSTWLGLLVCVWMGVNMGHLEIPFSGPPDSDFPADPDFGPGPVIQLGLDLLTVSWRQLWVWCWRYARDHVAPKILKRDCKTAGAGLSNLLTNNQVEDRPKCPGAAYNRQQVIIRVHSRQGNVREK